MRGARHDNQHFELSLFFLCDCSGSMSGARIAALNTAMGRVLPELATAADAWPKVALYYGVICFSSRAHWHIPADTALKTTTDWPLVQDASGLTALGQACQLLLQQLRVLETRPRQLAPVIVLVSDGLPTDHALPVLAQVLESGLGAAAVRYAIGLGPEADAGLLLAFTGHDVDRMALVDSAVGLKEKLQRFALNGVELALRGGMARG